MKLTAKRVVNYAHRRIKEKIISIDGMQYVDAPLPEYCTLGVNDLCFFRCRMCNMWKKNVNGTEKGFLNPVYVKKFLQGLSRIVKERLSGPIEGRFTIILSGGEPLTYPNILETISYAKSLGFRTLLPSNGFLINENMASKLRTAGLTEVNLSLDSLDPSIHDEIRGMKHAHKKIMDAIGYLSKNEYPQIGIGSVIQETTYQGMPDLVRWALSDPRIKAIVLMAIMQPNNTNVEGVWHEDDDLSWVWPKDIQKVNSVIDTLIKIKKANVESEQKGISKDKLTNTIPQLETFKKYFSNPGNFVKTGTGCNFDRGLMISPEGIVFMCQKMEKLGDIGNDDIRRIWSSKKADRIRKEIRACRTNCHELINCYYKEEYPFGEKLQEQE